MAKIGHVSTHEVVVDAMYPVLRAAVLVVASLFFLSAYTHAANVVGIDFGSEWIKAAYIKSGEKTGVAIVLDPASARKFPNTMAFTSSERFFGLVAAGKGHLHYPHLRQLLGKLHNTEYLAKCGIVSRPNCNLKDANAAQSHSVSGTADTTSPTP